MCYDSVAAAVAGSAGHHSAADSCELLVNSAMLIGRDDERKIGIGQKYDKSNV